MLTFVRFREVNDWEGETWNFWLQNEGNEAELKLLGRALKRAEEFSGFYDFPYELVETDVITEATADALVQFAEEGYMLSHSKVTGRLTLPVTFDTDDLYKGGILDFFHD